MAPHASKPALSSTANGRPRASALNFNDVVVARQPIVGMLVQDVEGVFDELRRNDPDRLLPLDLGHTKRPHTRWLSRAVRQFLSKEEGEGYWDFFKPTDHLRVSITDATYRTDTWVRVEGSSYFRLRLLLSGELRSERGAVIAEGPSGLLYVSPGASREGYFVVGGQPTHMVVLHCRPELLTEGLRLSTADIPPPFSALFANGGTGARHRVAFGSDIGHATQRIIDSRHQFSRALRGAYLETLSMEILVRVLGEFDTQVLLNRSDSVLSARDLRCIYDVRDYLSQHYAQPLQIPELARLVGINQTKLKAGFREVTGKTVYKYILQCRMERASELLLTGEYSVAEVAYAVGYHYPANFTAAFKRVHRRLPKCWVQGHSGPSE